MPLPRVQPRVQPAIHVLRKANHETLKSEKLDRADEDIGTQLHGALLDRSERGGMETCSRDYLQKMLHDQQAQTSLCRIGRTANRGGVASASLAVGGPSDKAREAMTDGPASAPAGGQNP